MRFIFLGCIKFYQTRISPLLPKRCRFYPTCSQYTFKAIEKHGVIKGTIMGVSRILRCQPFNKGGLDFVPDKFTLFRNKKSDKIGDEIINKNKKSSE
ncbi:membrane protein insertion efficiency factor YidD [Holzapfeliella sp. JNUCC 80]